VLLKKVVVTGATGFLGIALIKELVKNDACVYALCRKGSHRISRLDNLQNVQVIETDLDNPDNVNGIRGDVFYHVAWGGGRNEFAEQYKNIAQAVSCVELAARLGCRRFVGLGSQAEYGCTPDVITEATPLYPTTAYGSCKVAANTLTADLAKRLDIEHVWARVFSVYGSGDNANSLIPQLVKALQTKDEFALATDGKHMWNYLHEEDAARALRLLGGCADAAGVYNVASYESKPLREYVEEICKAVNSKFAVRYGSDKCDVELKASTERLQRCIGRFEKIGFADGCKEVFLI